MPISEDELKKIVEEVVKRMPKEDLRHFTYSGSEVVHKSVDEAVKIAKNAQVIFQDLGLQLRKKVIESMRQAAIENAEKLAKMAHNETGFGRWEHKLQKNILVATKTPGVEDLQPVMAYTGDKGLTLVEWAPFGVVAAVTPSTNPTATIINNSISILAAGNSVVFAPHPSAKECCFEAMRILHDAAIRAGAPPGVIASFEPITHETTKALLSHPDVAMYIVTGGPGIVKVAMTIGKPCKIIAAGPGNPPVIVDETALLPQAAGDIISGAGFDNCVLCTGEKEVFVVEAIWDRFIDAMRKDERGFELTREQMDELAKIVIKAGGRGCKEPVLNRDFVGKNASVLAKAIGINIPDSKLILWGIVPEEHVFVWTEQLMPVLPVVKVKDFDTALELAYEVEGGNHHTASIYSLNVANITKAARKMQCSIFVKNGPTYMGLGMGEGFATMSIGTPTGDGLTKARHFSRPLHCTMVGYLRIV